MNKPRIFLYFFLSSLVFIMFFHQIDAIEQDLGRHLLLGKIIVQTMSVPKTNLLSYSNPNFPFINTHWLSQVVFYLVENVTGFFGLLLFTTIVAVAAFLLQLLYVKKYHAIPLIIASLIYLQILLGRTDVRPEIFSFFFLSIITVVLYNYRKNFTKWIFIIPPIELLWVNTHIYFPIGILVTGLFLLELIITHRKEIKSKKTVTLAAVFLVSLFVLVFNPNTIRGAFYPLFVFQNYGMEIAENHNVFDMWNLFGHLSSILYFFIAASFLFLVMLITFRKTKLIDWLLVVTFTIIAASADRNLPLFVFATFIAFAGALNNLYSTISPSLKKHLYVKNSLLLLVGLFTLWQTIAIITVNPHGYAMPMGASKAVDFLEQNKISGPIFNNFDIGSYLLYRLYPQEKVFVDGRPEAYPVSFFKNIYTPMEQNKNIFQQEDKKYHFNVIFISYTDQTPSNQQFLRDINANPEWRLVYLDPLIVIYIKNSPKNQYITSTSILHTAQITSSDLTKKELNQLLAFYENIGWTNEIKAVDLKLLTIDPNSCSAISNLGTLLENENDAGYIIYANKYQSICH